jgi:putative transposase
MPRAHRHFIPGHVWHITHRCHEKDFLLKFARDRTAYSHWLFEAKKRFGLQLLDYVITSNHVHLLVRDSGSDVIAKSMQLVAGRTAQQYNQRKLRKGAFWEDRYHATAIETDGHLHRCLVYIDLNMVRAGVVAHPEQWKHGGYNEIQQPPQRYALIDPEHLASLCGFSAVDQLQSAHRHWVAEALAQRLQRDERWSQALAVGGKTFVDSVQHELGVRGRRREVEGGDVTHALREASNTYDSDFEGKKRTLSSDNSRFWDQKTIASEA